MLDMTSRRLQALMSTMLFAVLLIGGCSKVGNGGAGTDPPDPGSSGAPAPPPINITSRSLPNGQVAVPYSTTLTASGGTMPYIWTVAGGTLPPGLELETVTGTLSGTPIGGAYQATLTLQAKDSGTPSQTASVTLLLNVLPPALAVSSQSLPSGNVGIAYSAALTASGGTAPYSWSLTAGTLPSGLSFNDATGVISGTPTTNAAASALTFEVTDSENPPVSVSMPLTLTIAGVPLVITTSQLPDARVAAPYSQALNSSGGTGAVTWALTGGTLSKGLTFSPGTGIISGTPTVVAEQVPLTFSATDSGTPAQTQSAAFTLTVDPSGIGVTVSPPRAGVTIGQPLILVATTNDNAGVTWSVSPAGGLFSAAASANNQAVTFTAPTGAGVYTITATSVSDTTRSDSATVGVTDLAGVYTYHNDVARDGANLQEYALTTGNVSTNTFGKLFSCAVDGAVYAQPLWVANLSIAGATHNVVFVATQRDSVFAFDADASPCQQLWQVSLLVTGEMPLPRGVVGATYGDIVPDIGITGTPVIDPANGILYVVAKSVDFSGNFYQRLHALDLASGSERVGSPHVISGSYQADNGSVVPFSLQQENQRAALALSNGIVYVAWGSHEDKAPWYGWIMGFSYNGSTIAPAGVLNVAPNTGEAGIWMAGGAPSVDNNGNLYVITGNGLWDAASTTGGPTDDYGDSFLQLKAGIGQQTLGVSSFFTPSDENNDYLNDVDFGSGGSALVLNLSGGGAAGMPTHMVVGGGKDGMLYVLNGDQLGGSGDTNAWQRISLGQGIFATSAFWNSNLYIAPAKGALVAYAFDSTTESFTTTSSSASPTSYNWPGATPSVSASGTSNGIVWAIDSSAYCTPQSKACGPAVLYAYDARNLGTELWKSSLLASDRAGNAVKFTVPTVANGKVYVGTRGNNTGGASGSTSIPGEVDVYGLKRN